MCSVGTIVKFGSRRQFLRHTSFYVTKESLFLPMINKTHVSDVCAKIKSKLNVSGILVTFKEFKANERHHRRPSCLYFK